MMVGVFVCMSVCLCLTHQTSSAHDLASAGAEGAGLLPPIPGCGLGYTDRHATIASTVATGQIASTLNVQQGSKIIQYEPVVTGSLHKVQDLCSQALDLNKRLKAEDMSHSCVGIEEDNPKAPNRQYAQLRPPLDIHCFTHSVQHDQMLGECSKV